jgi:hypothetical protein
VEEVGRPSSNLTGGPTRVGVEPKADHIARNPKKRKPDGLIQTRLTESSKEGCVSKKPVLPMMIMMNTVIEKYLP